MSTGESTSVEKGTLVRYQPTRSNWYLAILRGQKKNKATIDLFSGKRLPVPHDQVQPFAEFMAARTKALYLDRSHLCRAFYGQDLLRLSADKQQEMQRVLRKHGYSYEPADWPSPKTRIYVRRDYSVPSVAPSRRDRELELLLPRWLDAQKMPPSSRDPLGLQAYAERIANKMLPGLTVTTTRIGYYGFLCWAIDHVNNREIIKGSSRREMLHRLERALVLCEFVNHGPTDDRCRLIGQRSRTQILQSAEDGSFPLPSRIVKNQTTAGALRLYATSLVSMGFLIEEPTAAADGKLPWTLQEPTGRKLARAFATRVPNGFVEFAFGKKTMSSETIRKWGRSLCFSNQFRQKTYRDAFLDGFALGDSDVAEVRFSTIQRLFKRNLLIGEHDAGPSTRSETSVPEDEADAAEDFGDERGLSNSMVLFTFYEEAPSAENLDFQEAAVFEFIGLGLSAIFNHAAQQLWGSGRIRIDALKQHLSSAEGYARSWRRPMAEACRRVRGVRELVGSIFEAEGATEAQAVLGGELLLAVLNGQPLAVAREGLGDMVVLGVFDEFFRKDSRKSIADLYSSVLAVLVERHAEVSLRKNRQRWCYLDGDTLVRDDLQLLIVGLHALRFPQLHALCADLSFGANDLHDGH